MLLTILGNLLHIAMDRLEILAEDATDNSANDQAQSTNYASCKHHLGMMNFFIAKFLVVIQTMCPL